MSGARDAVDAINAHDLRWPGMTTGPRSDSSASCWSDSPRNNFGQAFSASSAVKPEAGGRSNITGWSATGSNEQAVISSLFTVDGLDSPACIAGEVSKPIASAMIADLTANITSPSLKRTIGLNDECSVAVQAIKRGYLTGGVQSSSASVSQPARRSFARSGLVESRVLSRFSGADERTWRSLTNRGSQTAQVESGELDPLLEPERLDHRLVGGNGQTAAR